MTEASDRTKWPVWQQYLVVSSVAAAIAVVAGVFLMLRSAEELDEQLDIERVAQVEQRPEEQVRPAADELTATSDEVTRPIQAKSLTGSTSHVGPVAPSSESGAEDDSTPPTLAPDAPKQVPAAISRDGGQPVTSDQHSGDHSKAASAQPQAGETGKTAASATPSKPEPVAESDATARDAAAAATANGESASRDEKNNWLKLDEHGEPCKVTLSDGTVLELDTYSDSYQGYRALLPVDAVKDAEAVVDYQRDRLGPGFGAYFLRLDVAGGQMYWIELGGGGACRIRSADLNGQDPRILLNLRFQNAQALAIDPKRGKLYWANHAAGEHPAFGAPPDAAQAVWQADLDGSNPHPLFSAITNLGAVAVEPQSGDVFYFAGPRVVRASADGTKETVINKSLDMPYHGVQRRYQGFSATVDPKDGKIYWCANQGYVARANIDGSAFEVIWDGGGQISEVGIDIPNARIYWPAGGRMGVWRANTDGSQPQMLVAGGMGSPSSADIDSDRGYVYWTDQKFAGGDSYALIRRLKLPPPPVAETLPPPPSVKSILPSRQSAGGKVTLQGARLTDATHVRVIGDDGRQSDAKFNVRDDHELTLVLPERRDGVRRAAIAVEGPGGVTVTLPRGVSVIKPNDRRITVFDRLRENAFCFVVSPEQAFHRVERSLVFVPKGATSWAGGRGNTVLFVKDGSSGSATDAVGVVVYHEPFARITRRDWGAGERQYMPVPAIRPSFVESLLEYADAE